MCSCRKNAGANAVAGAPPPPPPPRRPVAPVRGRSAPVSRPVAQTREITQTSYVLTRQRDPTNPRRYAVVRVPKYKYIQKPLQIVDTAKWGPQLWRILHILSLRTATATAAWAALPKELDGALPCPDCAQHFHDWIRAHPLTNTTPDGIRDWVLALHNQVNERRQIAPWTVEQMTSTYDAMSVADATAALTEISGTIGMRGRNALRSLIATAAATAAAQNNPQPV